jgi:hypothetical protein
VIKNAAAVLLTILQLNHLKHAQQEVGLKPPSPPPKTKPRQPRPYIPLNPIPTKAPDKPSAPKTPAAETDNAVGQPVIGERTGSVLMPSPP